MILYLHVLQAELMVPGTPVDLPIFPVTLIPLDRCSCPQIDCNCKLHFMSLLKTQAICFNKSLNTMCGRLMLAQL